MAENLQQLLEQKDRDLELAARKYHLQFLKYEYRKFRLTKLNT